MTTYTVMDLARRLEGWTVVGLTPLPSMTEVRLAVSIHDPAASVGWWPPCATAVLYFDGDAPVRAYAGGLLATDSDGVVFGPEQDPLMPAAGRILETAVVVTEASMRDPVTLPTEAAEAIVSSGELIWPWIEDLPEEHRGLDRLAGVTRRALQSPALLTTVVLSEPGKAAYTSDTFMTDVVAVEVRRIAGDPVVAAYFPPVDVPSRLIERSGLGRLMAGGDVRGCEVQVRSTYQTESALVLGSLEWTETPEGLDTAEGLMGVEDALSHVLSMLPGGGGAGGKEVVGKA